MSSKIHPTAVIADGATIGADCEIAPYAVIDKGAVIGSGNKIGPHVYITGSTRMGNRNILKHGASIGGGPQDIHFDRDDTLLFIGDDNHIGEHCTLHRGSHTGKTEIGNNNYLMGNVHVGHDCKLGNHIIMANDSKLGGYVQIQDKVIASAAAGAHQHIRVGEMVIMGAIIRVTQDLLPFTMAGKDEGLNGLNLVGLKRSGTPAASIILLKEAYRLFCRERMNQKAFIEWLREREADPYIQKWREFIEGESKRGFTRHWASKARGAAEKEE